MEVNRVNKLRPCSITRVRRETNSALAYRAASLLVENGSERELTRATAHVVASRELGKLNFTNQNSRCIYRGVMRRPIGHALSFSLIVCMQNGGNRLRRRFKVYVRSSL